MNDSIPKSTIKALIEAAKILNLELHGREPEVAPATPLEARSSSGDGFECGNGYDSGYK